MRRRHFRKRRAVKMPEDGLLVCTLICLFVLVSVLLSKEIYYMVFPIEWYAANCDYDEKMTWSEAALCFVDAQYGFARERRIEEKSNNADCDVSLQKKDFSYFHDVFYGDLNNEYNSDENIVDITWGDEEDAVDISGERGENGQSDISGNSAKNGDYSDEIMSNEDNITKHYVNNKNESVFHKQETPVMSVNPADLEDFLYLKQHYYTVDATTSADANLLDFRKLMDYDATINQDASKPQILIYHTHSQETFADSVPGDVSQSIVGVGEKLANILRDEYGFNVIHDTGTYDVPNRDYAYSVSAPAIEKILAENPSVEVIIDLHRDGVAEGTHLVKEVGGRKTAQFMFFNGISYLNATGPIDYLRNPNIHQNLAFSFQMKMAADRFYPGFSRNIYLKGLRYNMHYREKSLLIEVGAQTNTVEEAMNATDPIAHILSMVLKGETQ